VSEIDKGSSSTVVKAYRDKRVLWSLILICILAYSPSIQHLREGAWPFGEDAMAAFGVWREFTRNAFSQGLLPLWNPHLFCGMPFLSNGQTSILYPPNLIYWIVPVPVALVFDALGHNILLACGAYALARALGLSRTASWLVAVSLSLSGTVSGHLFNGHMTWHAARAYLPWELWALLGYLRRGHRSYIYSLTIFFALQVASGYPPLVVLSVGWCSGLVFAWIVAKTWVRRKQTTRLVLPAGWLSHVAVAIVLIFLLAAVHLLPLREVSSLAVHGHGLPYELAVAGSGNWHSLLRFVLPDFFGNNSLQQWSLLIGAHEEAAYCGLLVTILAVGAPIFARCYDFSKEGINAAQPGREAAVTIEPALAIEPAQASSQLILPTPVLWLWPLLPLTALLAMGDNTAVYPWLLHHVPPLRMMRIPARWLETCCFTATLLAGFSFDGCLHRIRKEQEDKTHSRLILLLIFVGLTVALLGLRLFLASSSARSYLWMHTAQWNEQRPLAAQIATARWFRSMALHSTATALRLAIGMTFLLLIWQRSSNPFSRRLTEKLLLGVVLIDMIGLFWRSDKFLSAQTLNQIVLWPPRFTQLYRRGERWDTNQLSLESMNQAMPLNIDLFNGYDTMGSRRFFSFIRTFEGQSFWAAAYEKHSDSPLLRVTGLTHTLDFETDPNGKEVWNLFSYKGAWPRVYLSRHLLRVPEEKQLKVLSMVATGSFKEQGQPAVVAATAFHNVGSAPLQTTDRVVQWSRNLNEMQIQAQASAPSVLVQSEAWYPGWRAWVNGQSVPLEQANFLFRGVAVPAGVSSVRVVYEPVTYRFGLFLSLCGLSALGGIVMVQRRKF